MNAERLLKLAEHLEKGELAHKTFDFGCFNGGKISQANSCGTMGCALGELPAIDPEWYWLGDNVLWTGRTDSMSAWQCAEKYFDIDGIEAEHLFFPKEQLPEEFGGILLDCDATKEEVASNIRAFVAIKAADTYQKNS